MMTRPRDQVSAKERMVYIEEHISEPHPSMKKLQEVRDEFLFYLIEMSTSIEQLYVCFSFVQLLVKLF